MSKVPGGWAPVRALIVVELTTRKNPALTPPMETVAPVAKFAPRSVMVSPPADGPDLVPQTSGLAAGATETRSLGR